MCPSPDQQNSQPIPPHEVTASSDLPPESGPHPALPEFDEPLQTQDSKPPTEPILVFLVTDGPSLESLHVARRSEENCQKIVAFSIMPGAFYPEPDDTPGRVIPALDAAMPVYVKVDYIFDEHENVSGIRIFGAIDKVSDYLGRVSGNPIWHGLHQLTAGEQVCLSYDFKRKDGGLVPLPDLVIDSCSDIQRIGHDAGSEVTQGEDGSQPDPKRKRKRRDAYRALPSLNYRLQHS